MNGEDGAPGGSGRPGVEKIDLGEAWTRMTGLPFVWAFWAGRPAVLGAEDVRALQEARDAGVAARTAIAARLLPRRARAPGDWRALPAG